MVNFWHLARKRKWFEWWVVKGWLTWINLGAHKLQHNVSCSYPIIDGIQMLQDSLFEILFDFIPHCHHRSDFELYWFLCMHCQCGLYQILTNSCLRKLSSLPQPHNSCVIQRKQDSIDPEGAMLVVQKHFVGSRNKWGKTNKFFCKGHVLYLS